MFLCAATLRAETMYGQTNYWVLPDGDYGAYEMINGEVFVMSARAARNLSFQVHSLARSLSLHNCRHPLPRWHSVRNPNRRLVLLQFQTRSASQGHNTESFCISP